MSHIATVASSANVTHCDINVCVSFLRHLEGRRVLLNYLFEVSSMDEREARRRVGLALPHLTLDQKIIVERAMVNLLRKNGPVPQQDAQQLLDLPEKAQTACLEAGGLLNLGQKGLRSGHPKPRQ